MAMFTYVTDTEKGKQWLEFVGEVLKHIDTYTVTQYGDQVDVPSSEVNKVKMECYVRRMGKGARGKEEEVRDLFKIAHFACFEHKNLTE